MLPLLIQQLLNHLLIIFKAEETAEVDIFNHSLTQLPHQSQSKPSMPTFLTLLLVLIQTQLLRSMQSRLSLISNSELTKLMHTFLLNSHKLSTDSEEPLRLKSMLMPSKDSKLLMEAFSLTKPQPYQSSYQMELISLLRLPLLPSKSGVTTKPDM